MPRTSYSEILAEAAGVKIVTSSPEENTNAPASGKISLKMQKINRSSNNSLGFHLTKSKWDPFPWISYVENDSPADLAGLRTGDCLLSVDDVDLLGLKIAEIAVLIRKEDESHINIDVWRCPQEAQDDVGLALQGPLPDVARNLVSALSGMIRALECPICLETATPPISQCVYGHILCVVCRPKMTRCPVCRVRLHHGRCLLADNLHRVLRDTYFDANNSQTVDKNNDTSDRYSLHEQLFGKIKKQEDTLVATKSNRSVAKPRQFLLTRLLLGNREKAASADNLTRTSGIREEAASVHNTATVADSLLRLSLNDRVKSASTGELSRDQLLTPFTDSTSSSQIIGSSRGCVRHTVSQQSLNSQQPPILSGSTDSVSSIPLACPLLRLCNEIVTSHTLLEHIKSHQVPQIHFYSRNVTIPLPLPFGCEAFYVLHHDGCMFFFQVRSHFTSFMERFCLQT
ncbi:Probable E3 ubiquitin-protein ligase sina-like CG13030 [Harpegnathos saltator]|uniref:Probable E3 ubiquitin-protein ligase sina-like CG13030 n=1 Tax=Harpegnathos saltator TaxID=610380 RepID=E2B2V3_HARSA|nr:Probable E3 ubiquitin-protein ligase sina-like CG13030 [Harpegnathos saltator]